MLDKSRSYFWVSTHGPTCHSRSFPSHKQDQGKKDKKKKKMRRMKRKTMNKVNKKKNIVIDVDVANFVKKGKQENSPSPVGLLEIINTLRKR